LKNEEGRLLALNLGADEATSLFLVIIIFYLSKIKIFILQKMI
jgi:hypothetical protein